MSLPLPDMLRIAVAAAVLIPASVQDWKERRADDRYWMAGGAAGIALLLWDLMGSQPSVLHLSLALAIMWIYMDVFWSGEEIFGDEGMNLKGWNSLRLILYIVSFSLFGLGFYLLWGDMLFFMLFSVLAMILFIYLLYMFDVIKGGADAKALIMLSILFPHYPAVSSVLPALPLVPPLTPGSFSGLLTWEQIFFPFSFVVFMTAALLSLLIPIAMLMFNISRGDISFPQALFGYRMPLDEVKNHHVWLMERVVDGRLRVFLFPKEDDSDQIAALEKRGVSEVWVNPKIPFLIPITAGLFVSLLLGNVLLLIVG